MPKMLSLYPSSAMPCWRMVATALSSLAEAAQRTKTSSTPKSAKHPSPTSRHLAIHLETQLRVKRQNWPMDQVEEGAEAGEEESQAEDKLTMMPPSKANTPLIMGWTLMEEAKMRMMEACEDQAVVGVCPEI